MAKRSVSLPEINFAMAGYLLCIDLIFAQVTFGHLGGLGLGSYHQQAGERLKDGRVTELVELILRI